MRASGLKGEGHWGERERERERERETHTQTDRQTERETETDRQTDRAERGKGPSARNISQPTWT